eukprot:jgi/Botrbrau1/21378/Bobra.0503s0002.1
MYNLNWYGCPYDKEHDTDRCAQNAPPSCFCSSKQECKGYCAGPAPPNVVLPSKDYYDPLQF